MLTGVDDTAADTLMIYTIILLISIAWIVLSMHIKDAVMKQIAEITEQSIVLLKKQSLMFKKFQ